MTNKIKTLFLITFLFLNIYCLIQKNENNLKYTTKSLNKRRLNNKVCKQDSKQKPKEVTDLRGHTYQILYTWLRDDVSYTQGFKFLQTAKSKNLKILQSTGEYGKSRIEIIKVNSCNDKFVRTSTSKKLANNVFGEGTDLIKFNDNKSWVLQLTWQNRVIFVYDYPSLSKVGKIDLPKQIKEGWGLTSNPKTGIVYITDGSSKVFTCSANVQDQVFSLKCDPGKSVFAKKTGSFKKNQLNLGAKYHQRLPRLNELEYKDGKLYMNQYLTNNIRIFDIKNWKLLKTYNMEYLRQYAQIQENKIYNKALDGEQVLNGITWNPKKSCWMLTGKDWPVVYCIKFEE